jgi:hypothetical protein
MIISPFGNAHNKFLPRKTINYYPLMGFGFSFACSQLVSKTWWAHVIKKML